MTTPYGKRPFAEIVRSASEARAAEGRPNVAEVEFDTPEQAAAFVRSLRMALEEIESREKAAREAPLERLGPRDDEQALAAAMKAVRPLVAALEAVWPYVHRPPMISEQPEFEAAIEKVRAAAAYLVSER